MLMQSPVLWRIKQNIEHSKHPVLLLQLQTIDDQAMAICLSACLVAPLETMNRRQQQALISTCPVQLFDLCCVCAAVANH